MNFNVNVDDVPPGLVLILLGILVLLLLNKGFIDFLKGITGKNKIQEIRPTSTRVIFAGLGIFFLLSGVFYIFYDRGEQSAACIYENAANTDLEAISWLIHQEAQVAVSEDIDLVKGIFADKARIVDYLNRNSPIVWNNPIDRYQLLFTEYQFIDDRNTGIKAIGTISGDIAYYVSGSSGTYIHDGQTQHFQNADDANHWTVQKINGCWKITKFEFNASGIVFP